MDRRLAAAVVVKHLAIVVATGGFALERELRRNELFGIRQIIFRLELEEQHQQRWEASWKLRHRTGVRDHS